MLCFLFFLRLVGSLLIEGQESDSVSIGIAYPFNNSIVDYDWQDSKSVVSHISVTSLSKESYTSFVFCDGRLVNSTWLRSISTQLMGLSLGLHTLDVLVTSGVMNASQKSDFTASISFTVGPILSESKEDTGIIVTRPLRIALAPGQTVFEWAVVGREDLQNPRVVVSAGGEKAETEVRGELSGSIALDLPYGQHSTLFQLYDGHHMISSYSHPSYVPKIKRVPLVSNTAVSTTGNRDGSDGLPGIAIKYPPSESIFQCHPDLHVVMHYSVVNSPSEGLKSIVVMDGQAVQETDSKDVSVNLAGFLPGFHEIMIVLAENYTQTTQKRGPQIRNKIRFGIEFSHEEGPVVCSIFLPNILRLQNVPIPEWAMYARAEKRIMGKGVDDGVLETLFNDIDEVDSIFVEFGAGPALECVTRYLREERAWKGQLFDPEFEDPELFLAKENPHPASVVDIMEKYRLPTKFDLLVLPSSCADFHIWQALGASYKPRVVLVGFNSRIGPHEDKVVPFEVTEEIGSFSGYGEACERYVGSSALAMMRLGWSLGYSLVHADTRGQRLYFVETEEVGKCRTKGIDDPEQLLKVLRFYPQRGVDPSDGSLHWAESGLEI